MKIHPLDIRSWGKQGWNFLHSCSFAYPENPSLEQQVAARNVFLNIGDILPCKLCTVHYKEGIQQLGDPPVQSRSALTKWLVDIHNRVNKMNGKPIVTYEAVRNIYESSASDMDGSAGPSSRIWIISGITLGVFVVVMVSLLVVFMRKKKE